MLRQTVRSFATTPIKSAFARASILGSVGAVNFRETKDGNRFIQYSLAVNKTFPEETTEWYNISVFNEGQIAALEKFIKPGTRLLVDADIKQKVIVDEATGEKKYVTNFRQKSFDLLYFGGKRAEDADVTEHEE
ncbi:putative telomere binding protein [Scheffersomyces coipomensis]|uniref:putative telomere binding protein n=1 Tax=Scheffersomyces coipomensis TaxID=1788519 RepID=UPI00315D80C6